MKKAIAIAIITASLMPLTGCFGMGGDTDTSKKETENIETDIAENNESQNTNENTNSNASNEVIAADGYDVSGVNLTTPDVTINYGDYAAMSNLANDIREGKMSDKVVLIDGSHSNNVNHAIMEENDAGEGIGFEFAVQGMKEEDYPAHGARIRITGVVKDTGEEAFGAKVYKIIVPAGSYSPVTGN